MQMTFSPEQGCKELRSYGQNLPAGEQFTGIIRRATEHVNKTNAMRRRVKRVHRRVCI